MAAGTEQVSHRGALPGAPSLAPPRAEVRSDFLEEGPSATELRLDGGQGGGSLLFLSGPGQGAPQRGGCYGEKSH